MARVLMVLMLFTVADLVRAESANMLIAAHKVEINNKGKPIRKTLKKRYVSYQLINAQTGNIEVIDQGDEAIAIRLEPGDYCFKWYKITMSQRLEIVNPVCFRVPEQGVINVGTWTIGYSFAKPNAWHARLLKAQDNYDEIERIVGINGSVPALFYRPDD